MHSSIGLVFAVSFVLTSTVNGRCPRPSELPTQYNNRKFFCARMWEHSSYHSFQSCIGARYDAYNDQSVGHIGGWWNDKVSSLVVRPGCKLTLWEDISFRGSSRTFTGVAHSLKSYRGVTKAWGRKTNWNDQMTAFYCTCEFSNAALTCRPRDTFRIVASCENLGTEQMR